VSCSELQRVAVCCSVLQCVAVCLSLFFALSAPAVAGWSGVSVGGWG